MTFFVLYPVEWLRRLEPLPQEGGFNAILGLGDVANEDLAPAIMGSGIIFTATKNGVAKRLSNDTVLNKVLRERKSWTKS